MPISFGAVNFGVTAPSGYLQDSTEEVTCEVATIRNASGQTVIAQAKPRTTTTTTVNTKGDVDLLSVPEGAFSGAKLTSAKVTESNDDFAVSSATYTLFA
jgi:hypothetical protein